MEFNNETIRIAVQLYVKNETEGEEKYGHINTWNVSNVTDMHGMFCNAGLFNQPLDKWNVSNVTDMIMMFSHTDAFNQPLNTWNVSNVTNMYGMFSRTFEFNKPLNNWNVSNVTSMTGLFDFTEIGNMLKKHNLTNENYFDKKCIKMCITNYLSGQERRIMLRF